QPLRGDAQRGLALRAGGPHGRFHQVASGAVRAWVGWAARGECPLEVSLADSVPRSRRQSAPLFRNGNARTAPPGSASHMKPTTGPEGSPLAGRAVTRHSDGEDFSRGQSRQIVLIEGDGIGPEVTQAACRVVAATGVKIDWVKAPAGIPAAERFGEPLPEETLEMIRRYRV